MDKKYVYLGVVAVIAMVLGVYIGSLRGSAAASQQNSNDPKVFFGRIVGQSPAPQTLTGLHVLSDQGCTTDPATGLSNCTSQIAEGNGTISFNYEHNMMAKPCLSYGDIVTLQTESGGAAVVTRTYWGGAGGA